MIFLNYYFLILKHVSYNRNQYILLLLKGGSHAVCVKMINEHIGSENVKLSTPVAKIEQVTLCINTQL